VITRKFGLPLLRPKGVVTPCNKCPKIPKSAPHRTREYAEEMTDKNYQAFKFHRECKAVGNFPDDPLVKRHAEIIEGIVEAIKDSKLNQLIGSVSLAAAMGGQRGSTRSQNQPGDQPEG